MKMTHLTAASVPPRINVKARVMIKSVEDEYKWTMCAYNIQLNNQMASQIKYLHFNRRQRWKFHIKNKLEQIKLNLFEINWLIDKKSCPKGY